MSTDKQYVAFILECLSGIRGISARPMMGEYVVYCCGKVIGGIYDNQFLIKQTNSAELMFPNGKKVIPYPGAKEMLLVEDLEDKEFMKKLIEIVAAELPLLKSKKIQNSSNKKRTKI